jgi:ABC-type uncharacterized transport system permease subunit
MPPAFELSPGFYVATYAAAVALYVAAAAGLWRQLGTAAATRPATESVTLGATWFAVPALLLHGGLLAAATFAGPGLHFGFAHALSATFWIAAVAVWVESLLLPLHGLLVFVLLAAAVTMVLPGLFGGVQIPPGADTLALRLHLATAILAYSLLATAAVHALLMASIDRSLHAGGAPAGLSARLMVRLPPLLVLETLLFRLIGAGFVFLTLTLATGVVFSEEVFGLPVRFGHKDDYKADFAVTSWLVFAALLAGRRVFGWRGRTALRWTLSGFAFLLLAYVGSRFVLEVIQGRYA